MKRSQNVKTTRFRKALPNTTCLAVSVSLVLSGCSPEPAPLEQAQIYQNAEECRQVYPDQGALCEQIFGSAQMDHLATAPRFTDKLQCEVEFGEGNCESAPESDNAEGGSNWFMPMMMGYMMGSLMSRGGSSIRQTPVYSSKSASSPLKGKWVTPNGTVVGDSSKKTVTPPSSAFNKPSTPQRVTQIGGFGRSVQQKAQASTSNFSRGSSSTANSASGSNRSSGSFSSSNSRGRSSGG